MKIKLHPVILSQIKEGPTGNHDEDEAGEHGLILQFPGVTPDGERIDQIDIYINPSEIRELRSLMQGMNVLEAIDLSTPEDAGPFEEY